jgi:DNA-directed RNA polymerase subunit M/transcription elongation factor TFIIS
MGSIHAAGEWLRLSEHYRGMTDGELIAIARDRSKLTEIAQQILAQELSQRKLTVEPEEQPTGPESTSRTAMAVSAPKTGDSIKSGDPDAADHDVADHDATDPYADDRKLFEICVVWSLRDALQVQRMLDVAGIPFFMGEEKATSVDSVTSNFAQGVSVQIMSIGWPWARQALQYYEPKDVPESEKQPWDEEVDVRCPSCRSKDILFEQLVETPNAVPPKFKWTCTICGHEWQDDGLATKG